MSVFKRRNPELFEALRAESKKRIEAARAREVSLKDLPIWLVALLGIVAVVGFMGELGLLNFNPLLESLLIVLMVLFLAYYFLYKRRIRKEKQQTSLDSQTNSRAVSVAVVST
jgi:uncharacterized membrane protein YfcA